MAVLVALCGVPSRVVPLVIACIDHGDDGGGGGGGPSSSKSRPNPPIAPNAFISCTSSAELGIVTMVPSEELLGPAGTTREGTAALDFVLGGGVLV